MFLRQSTKSINYTIKLENKLLSQIVYNKLFIRSNFLRNKDLKMVDNNTNFYLLKTIKKTSNLLNGNSCLMGVFLLKHKLNNHFNFEYLINFTFLKNSLAEEKNLFFYISKKKTPISLLILYPVKGGCICFSLGIKAFLPSSHLKTFLVKNCKKKKRKLFSRVLFFKNVNFLCVNKKFNFFKSSLLFKISGQLSKKFILSYLKRDKLFKKRIFNSIKLKKKNTALRYSNFIFLKKKKKSFTKNKKINSTSRSIKLLFNFSNSSKLKFLLKMYFFLRVKNSNKNKAAFSLKINKILSFIALSKFSNIFKNILKFYVISLFKSYP